MTVYLDPAPIVSLERFDEVTGQRRGFYTVSVDNVAFLRPITKGHLLGHWCFWRLRTGGNVSPWIISASSAHILYSAVISRDTQLQRASALINSLSVNNAGNVVLLYDALPPGLGSSSPSPLAHREPFTTHQVTSGFDGETAAFYHVISGRRMIRFLDLRDNVIHYPLCDYCRKEIRDYSAIHRKQVTIATSTFFRAFCLTCDAEALNAQLIR